MPGRSCPPKDKDRRLSEALMSKGVKEKMCPWKGQLTSPAFWLSFVSFGFPGHAGRLGWETGIEILRRIFSCVLYIHGAHFF